MTSPPILADIGPLASTSDAWLCDIWGVLHNGAAAIPGAAEACARFRAGGGRVLLVSNAPRPAADVAMQLAGLGITAASYDGILTSGDVTRDLLEASPRGGFFHLGPARHRALFKGISDQPVSKAAALHIVCTGLDERHADEQPDDYRDLLIRLARRGLPMLCANPDVKVDAGGTIAWCAGALAAIYADLGGHVTYAGKPHGEIYRAARMRVAAMSGGAVPDARLLAIGDGVETDLRGAMREGIRSLYIASRIHLSAPLTAQTLGDLCSTHRVAPVAAMASLRWTD